jgi:predicted dehydrogenase
MASHKDSSVFNLGVVGLGHWFTWLETGIGKGTQLNLKKAVGTKPFEQKVELLTRFGISRENYYLSDNEGRLPEQFFQGLDIVHISDPNMYHAEQTKEVLAHDGRQSGPGQRMCVVTEKTLAANRREFEEMASFIRKNGHENDVYLHLHYIHKQPTIALASMLPGLVSRNGRITSIKATFFEEANGEDSRRTWLFGPENGGIFMDWIHPFEVIFYSTRCKFGELEQVTDFATNTDYDKVNPTGVEATVPIIGQNSANGATATVRVAKGVKNGYGNKSMALTFESGSRALLYFPGHEAEFNVSGNRGRIDIFDGKKPKLPTASHMLTGPNSSELFIRDVLNLCTGKNTGLTLDEITEIFKPQWEYQQLSKQMKLIKEEKAVNEFLKNGIMQART